MEDGGLKMLVNLDAFLDKLLGVKEDKENPRGASTENATTTNGDQPAYQPSPPQGRTPKTEDPLMELLSRLMKRDF